MRRQTDGLNLHGRLSAFPISRMHTSNGTDNKRRQFRHKSRPQILPRLRQFGFPLQDIFADSFARTHASFFFFFIFFSLSFHFILRASTPPFHSSSLPSSTDGLIQHGELNKQKVRLPGRRFREGREEISVEFHSRHIGNPLSLPLFPSLGRLNWTFEWRGLLRSVFFVAAAPVFSGSLAKERWGYRYC